MANQTVSESIALHSDPKPRSISEALSVLDHAAQESAHEIQHLLKKDDGPLRHILSTVEHEADRAIDEFRSASYQSVDAMAESLARVKDQVIHTATDTVTVVDRSVRANPWYFIGGAAAAALTVGYALGLRKSR